MKKIQVPSCYISESSDEAFQIAKETYDVHRQNAKNVIFASSHIEHYLAAGITRYFFGEDYPKRQMLDDLVVSTDSFSFSAKRKAFLSIIKTQGILSGPELDDFEKSIARVIRYRNMFTHGTPVYSESGCILHYSEGAKKLKEITDDFLAKVERELNSCFFKTEEVVQKIRIMDA